MTQEKWLNISQGFLEKWQFPNCIGAVDGGKQVKTLAQLGTISVIRNFLVLMAVMTLTIVLGGY